MRPNPGVTSLLFLVFAVTGSTSPDAGTATFTREAGTSTGATVTFTGRVVDDATGAPIASAQVWVVEPLDIEPLPLPEVTREEDEAPPLPFPLELVDLTSGTPVAPRGARDLDAAGGAGAAAAPAPLDPARVRELLELLPHLGTDGPSPDAPGAAASSFDAVHPVGGGGTSGQEAADGTAPMAPATTPVQTPPPAAAPGEDRVLVYPQGEAHEVAAITFLFPEPATALGGPSGRTGSGVDPDDLHVEPAVEGTWRWMDPRTLQLVPDAGRLPGATSFRIRGPDGLDHTFSTRGVRVTGGVPYGGPTEPRPLILLAFDQRVDAERVLEAARLTVGTGDIPLRLVSHRELEAHPRHRAAAEAAGADRWVALEPTRDLPLGAEAELLLDADMPSAEGPLPAGRAQRLRFAVHEAFRLQETDLGDPGNPFTALSPVRAEFSTPVPSGLILEHDASELVRVVRLPTSPDDPDAFPVPVSLSVRSGALMLAAPWAPFNRYRIEFLAPLVDAFGQSLEGAREVTVHFGAPPPRILLDGEGFLASPPDPAGLFELSSVGLRELEVEVRRVEPEDWPAYLDVLSRRRPPEPAGLWDDLPGERTHVERLELGPEGGEFVRSTVALGAALDPLGRGHAIVRVSDPSGEVRDELMWVQRSELAAHARWDDRTLHARVWRLGGSPGDGAEAIRGARIRFPASGATAPVGPDGRVIMPLPEAGDSVLVVETDDDRAILPQPGRLGTVTTLTWEARPGYPAPSWYVASDRGLYRPGESGHVWGWLRHVTGTDAAPSVPRDIDAVRVRIEPSAGDAVFEGSAPLGPDGTFHIPFELPSSARTGRVAVRVEAERNGQPIEGWRSASSIEVREFQRPEYELTLEADPGPHVAEEVVHADLEARYFDGPGLGNAEVEWSVRARPLSVPALPGWSGWSAGIGSVTWRWPAVAGAAPVRIEGRTNAEGRHEVELRPGSLEDTGAVLLTIEARVRDLDVRTEEVSSTLPLHPAAWYPLLRPDRRWVEAGTTTRVHVATADLDGTLIPGASPTVVLERVEPPARVGADPRPIPGTRVEASCEAADPERLPVSTSAPEGAQLTCEIGIPEPGLWTVTARVQDEAGRASRTTVPIYALSPGWRGTLHLGPGAVPSPVVGGAPVSGTARLEVTADRDVYQPGDTARFLVRAGGLTAGGTLFLERGAIRSVVPLELEQGTALVEIPLEGRGPGTWQARVEVDASPELGTTTGNAWFRIDFAQHRLDVALSPDRRVAGPGEEVEIGIVVTEPAGRPASRGRVTLWVVDDAVFHRAGYQLRDPLAALSGGGSSILRGTGLEGRLAWPRIAPPRGVSARLVHRWTGRPIAPAAVDVRIESASGEVRALEVAPDGTIDAEDLAPGPWVLVIEADGMELLRTDVEVGEAGIDLGYLAIAAPMDGSIMLQARSFDGEASMRVLTEGASGNVIALREDFRPLVAFEAGVELDEDGQGSVRVRLPDTMTRYRILAMASWEEDRFGTGETTLTARRDLQLRAHPPAFLLPGDRTRVPVLVQNHSGEEIDVEVAIRPQGLRLQGEGGYRVRVPAGDRREVGFLVQAEAEGAARFELVAVSGGLRDGVAETMDVRTGAVTRTMALHGTLEPGERVEIPVARPEGTRPGHGEVRLLASTGDSRGEADLLGGLLEFPYPWPQAVIGRILALTPDPSPELRPRLDVEAASLIAILAGPDGLPAALLPDAALALAAAEAEGVPRLLVLRPSLLRVPLEEALASPDELDPAVVPAYLRAAEAARSDPDWIAETLERWIGTVETASLPTRALGDLLALAATPAPLAAEVLRVIENRTVRSGGTAHVVDVRAAAPLGPTSTSPTGDAVVLEGLLRSVPEHELVPLLARGLGRVSRASSESSWHQRPLVQRGWIARALALHAAQESPPEPARLQVAARLGGLELGREHLEGVASASWSVPLDQFDWNGAGADSGVDSDGDGTGALVLESEGSGRLDYRATLTWALAADAEGLLDRGFALSRRYEAVDDEDDVRRDEDGTWRIRAGARVRVHLLVTTPVGRQYAQVRDPVPAGLRAHRLPVLVPGVRGEIRSDEVAVLAPLIRAGPHDLVYLAVATVPGTYHVPPAQVEELDQPEVFGTSAPDRVVIEPR
jgi:alpha-2-macroglobulin